MTHLLTIAVNISTVTLLCVYTGEGLFKHCFSSSPSYHCIVDFLSVRIAAESRGSVETWGVNEAIQAHFGAVQLQTPA